MKRRTVISAMIGMIYGWAGAAQLTIDQQVAARNAAKRSGDASTARNLERRLNAQGVTLTDTHQGTYWGIA